ncbi:hypothetical protein [Caenimonas aquaedulcis]|uniref:Uncharacterized protein n=1 Tax=Caenimonas aquaedulcis TaxID=2793270 RepID=A0A931H5P5_9BURK|nr:hypothetical protein [Caenimonas aquaedulcis]MBG9389023.1 hypothetical protein [Caenimonas aquaedulcis]
MKVHHTPAHWVLVALTLAALLLVLRDAHGQGGSAAVFEGRPAQAGANGGLGAQAGMPQGGIGVQGTDAAQRSLRLGKPTGLDEMRQAKREGLDMVEAADKDTSIRKDIAPARDRSVAKEERSSTKKVAKSAKKTWRQARHGTMQIDATAER